MNFAKNKRISDVYFSGGFFHHITNEKKGKKQTVNVSFQKDGKNWYIPAIYICPKGIVADICVETDYNEYCSFIKSFTDENGEIRSDLSTTEYLFQERNNPLNHSFDARLLRNKKTILCSQMQSIVYLPDNTDDKEALRLVKHYKLNQSSCWSIYRICFPCYTKSNVTTLAIQIKAPYDFVTASKFSIAAGEKTTIIHPVTKKEYLLEAVSLTDEVFRFSNSSHTMPQHYKMLRYTLTPEPPSMDYIVRDVLNSDPIIPQNQIYEFLPDASQSLAIIGGADGPSVLFAICETKDKRIHTVCSALHFEPKENVKWKFAFTIKIQEDKTITIKGGKDELWQSWKDVLTEGSTTY